MQGSDDSQGLKLKLLRTPVRGPSQGRRGRPSPAQGDDAASGGGGGGYTDPADRPLNNGNYVPPAADASPLPQSGRRGGVSPRAQPAPRARSIERRPRGKPPPPAAAAKETAAETARSPGSGRSPDRAGKSVVDLGARPMDITAYEDLRPCAQPAKDLKACMPLLVRGPPQKWTLTRHDGPAHLGLWYTALPEHQMAVIISDCAPSSAVTAGTTSSGRWTSSGRCASTTRRCCPARRCTCTRNAHRNGSFVVLLVLLLVVVFVVVRCACCRSRSCSSCCSCCSTCCPCRPADLPLRVLLTPSAASQAAVAKEVLALATNLRSR